MASSRCGAATRTRHAAACSPAASVPRLQWFVPVLQAIPDFAKDLAASSMAHGWSWKQGDQDTDTMYSAKRAVFEDLNAKYGVQIRRLAADPANGFPDGFVFNQDKLFHLRQNFRNEHAQSPALEAALDLAGCCGEEKQRAARARAASLGLPVAPPLTAPAVLRLSNKEDVEARTVQCTILKIVAVSSRVDGTTLPAVFNIVRCTNIATDLKVIGFRMLKRLQALPRTQLFPCMFGLELAAVGTFGKQYTCATCVVTFSKYAREGKFVSLVPGRVAGNAHGDACPVGGECKLHGAAMRGPFTLPPPPPPPPAA